jgi:hypothetical protein
MLAEREGTVARACKYVLSLIRGRDTRQPAVMKKGPRALLLPPHTAKFIIVQE